MGAGLLDQARTQWANYLWRLWKSGKWDGQPEDERIYGQRHLAEHLDESGLPGNRLYGLLSESWLRSWLAVENAHDGFTQDVERVWLRAEEAGDYAIQIKCALCVSSAAAFSANVPAQLLGLW